MEPTITPPAPMMTPPPVVTPPPVATPPPVVPPTPPAPAPSGGHKEMRLILPALLVILILGALYYWYSGRTSTPAAPATTATSTATSTASDVSVTQVNLASAATPDSKLPSGFPSDIPVETATLTQSYSAVYADHGVTQYTVNYTSTKTEAALWALYTGYVTSAGLTQSTSTNKTQGVLDASNGKNDLDVLISPHGSMNLVQITYLKRQ